MRNQSNIKMFKTVLGLFVIFVGMFLIVRYTTVGVYTVKADELENINSEIEQKKEQINKLRQEINATLNTSRSLSSKIAKLEDQDTRLKKLYDEYESLITKHKQLLEQTLMSLDKRKRDLEIQQVIFYLETQGNYVFYILDAQNIHDLIDRFTLFSVVSYQSSKELASLNQEVKSLQDRLQALEQEKKEVQEQITELEAQISNLRAEYNRLRVLASQKSRQVSGLNKEIVALSKRAQEIIRRKALANLGGAATGGNNLPVYPVVNPEGNPGQYVVTVGGVDHTVAAPLVFSFTEPVWEAGKYFSVSPCSGDCRYYGGLLFRKDANVYVINFLPMRFYLYGLGEMPSSWHLEALKTQAVAGRTYAYRKIGAPRTSYYHIVDTTADQNYVGAGKILSSYGSNWKNAVDATLGQILTVGGNPITAWYHSTCGGHTLSSAEVWGGTRSYAQAEPDRYQSNGQWVGYDSMSSRYHWFAGNTPLDYAWIEDLIDATIYFIKAGKTQTAQNQVGCGPNQCVGVYYDYRKGNIKNLLGNNSISAKVGTITDIKETFNDGSVNSLGQDSKDTKTLRIVGTDGTYDLDAQTFKLVYNIRSPGTDWIASTLFDISKVGSVWKVYSYGWGHRVGMCQYGAYGRAKAGQTYTQILQHYYNGVQVSTVYGSQNIPVIKVGLQKTGGDVTIVSATASFNILDKNGQVITTVQPGTKVYVKR